jgi:membrane protease YdiL (CAAX protease family)
MTVNPNLAALNAKSPVHQLIVSLLIVIVIGALLFYLLILAGSLIFKADPWVLGNPFIENGLKEAGFIKYSLMVQTISFFLVPAVIILTKLNPGYKSSIMDIKTLRINDLMLVIILAICTFPVTGLAGRLNSGMVLPDGLSGVGEWMRDKEDYADRLLDLIMTPETLTGMWLNIIVIAALPAISEELIFRGVFQKIFQNIFRSGHLSVWFISFLFSAIHFQFYGFLPRFILGLIFGYLFLWSRNLWLPVIAHFINNAVPVAGAYIKGWEAVNSPSAGSIGKQITIVIFSLLIGIVILDWFRQGAYKDRKVNPDENDLSEL